MKNATTSVHVFGIYLIIFGAAMIAVPNLILGLFGFPTTPEVWIRAVGVLAATIGYYYVQLARLELVAFYRYTIYGRFFVFLSLTAFVLLGYAQPTLILFGLIDLLGALWTFLSSRTASPKRLPA